jgi:hypothetical protein
MDLSVQVSPIRRYAIGTTVPALALLSPVVAFLMLIAAEALIDLLLVAGASAISAVAGGAIALVLSRNFWRRARDPEPLTFGPDRVVDNKSLVRVDRRAIPVKFLAGIIKFSTGTTKQACPTAPHLSGMKPNP